MREARATIERNPLDKGAMSLVQVDEIDTPHVEHSLQRVIFKTGARWTPGYVLARIASGEAGLFQFTRGGDHIAYMVVERLSGFETVMNIWILAGIPADEDRDRMIALTDDLARSVGASHWKLESPREGWGRALGKYLTETRMIYERKVP